MSVTAANITNGKATVKAVYGTGAPVDLGATDGPAVMTHNADVEEFTAEQSLLLDIAWLSGKRITVKVNLAEATLANIAMAQGEAAAAVDSGVLTPAGNNTLPEIEVEIVGDAPGSSTTRTIAIARCVALPNTELSYTKKGVVMVPIEFLCYTEPVITDA